MVLQLVFRLLDSKCFGLLTSAYVLLLALLRSMVRERPFGLHRNRHCRLHKQVGANEWHGLQLRLVQMLGYLICEA